jgi:tetratricopeptide (TPR) repeat protein
MEDAILIDNQSRTDFFRQVVLTNLDYWREQLADEMSDLTALNRDRANILTAISFGFDVAEAWPAVYDLVITFSRYMEKSGFWDIWLTVLQRALAIARRDADRSAEVDLLALLARLSQRQSHFQSAIAYYRSTIRLAHQLGDDYNIGRACTNLGYLYIEQGHWYRAEVLCQYALDIFDRIDNAHGRAHTENHLGVLRTRQCRWQAAQQHFERACALWKARDDHHGLMYGLMNLGVLYIYIECADKVLDYSKQALQQAKLAGEELESATVTMNIGIGYRLQGALSQAATYTRQAETIFRRFSHRLGLALVLDNWGLIYLRGQNWVEAEGYFNAALTAWRNLDNRYGEIRVMVYLVEADLVRGDQKQAHTRLSQVEHMLRTYDPGERYLLLRRQVAEHRRNLTGTPDQ